MKNKFILSCFIALVLTLVAATVVWADNLLVDGDGLIPVVEMPSLALGNVCTETTVTKTIVHAINAVGHPGAGTNVYANSSSVTVSIASVSGTGLSASGGGSIALPYNWVSLGNGTKSDAVSSSVTFVAGATPRAFSGTVNYDAVGISSKDSSSLKRSDRLDVTANVVFCDTTPPTLHLPDNMTVEASSPAGAAVTYAATADDANPEHPAVTCAPASGSTFGFGTTTVNCSATDAAGNTANGSFTVTVQDTTPPVVTPPSDVTVEALDSFGAVVTYSGESAADLVDGAVPLTCSPASGATFALGQTTVTCSAADSRGNTGTNSFVITVQDTTAPVLSLPADITVEAAGPSGAAVDFTATASDTVDGSISPVCTANSGDTFPLGSTTVNCSAEDSNGNTASGSFLVNVVDTTAPVLTLPTDFSVEATGPDGAVAAFSVAAEDLVDGPVGVICSFPSGSTFALGANPVNCSASDAHGNTASGSFSITVVDTTAPALTLPADQQIEATGPSGATAVFTANATDLVDGDIPVICDATSGDTFPLGTTTVTCSATDAHDNKAQGSFVIIVVDTTPPAITYTGRTPANGFGWNNTDVTVTWTCSDLVGVEAETVTVTVSMEGADQTATGICEDTSGNQTSDTQIGINIDKTKPAASATRTPGANAFGWNNTDVTVSFNGTDNLSGIDTCSPDAIFGEGARQTASGTCVDKAGNTSEAAVVTDINVDKTAPIISGAPDRPANANGWYNADVTVSFTCSDGLSGVDTCSAPSTLGEGEGQSVTGTVSDKAGNSATFIVDGINIDETAPAIDVNLDKLPAATGWFNIATGVPTISFTCSDALSDLDGVCPALYTFGDGADQKYEKTIFDKAGNSATAGVNGVNVDTTAPTITASVSPARPASGWWNIASGAPTVSFTCNDTLSGVVACPAAFTFGEGEDQTHGGTVYDAAGNPASDSVSNIDVDLTAPTLTWNGGPADGASYYFGSVPAAPTCAPSDALSGPNGCSVTGYGTTVGAHTMVATASDKAGNTYSESRTYTVLAWTLKGFYQPVDMNGVYNTVKNGSTVPLKFELFAGPTELTDVTDVKSLTYAQTTCTATATTDEIETLATGGTVLRYDLTGGQFIFNWKTPSTAGKCYRVTMTTLDGSSLVAYFKLK